MAHEPLSNIFSGEENNEKKIFAYTIRIFGCIILMVSCLGLSPSINDQMNALWAGESTFHPILSMQISTVNTNGQSFVNPMDQGTQIVPQGGIWYLFNREYDYAQKPPQCGADFSRIVVKSSADLGKTWSREVVVAEPNLGANECAVGDGHAYYDAETETWHYLSQVLTVGRIWNINHFQHKGADPMSAFTADPGNPVVHSGSLWRGICGAGKSCPVGTGEEGTPEISFQRDGYFYVTFHGAYYTGSKVLGYRGMAKTADFHNWIMNASDLPNDAIWSGRDCQSWNVNWNLGTGCIGGGHASSLITPSFVYLLIESADISLACTSGQNWVAGLARASYFVPSGSWNQFSGNPLLRGQAGSACGIQYPRLFQERGAVYLCYWTADSYGVYFHVARLAPGKSPCVLERGVLECSR